MKTLHLTPALLLLLTACHSTPTPPKNAPIPMLLHLDLTQEGASPEALNEIAAAIARRAFAKNLATHITTVSTFDKTDIYLAPTKGDLTKTKTALSDIITSQELPASITVGEILQVPATGLARGLGVVRMQTIKFTLNHAALEQNNLTEEDLAAAVTKFYQIGSPASQDTLDQLNDLTLKTPQGKFIPLPNLATLTLQQLEDPIIRSYPR